MSKERRRLIISLIEPEHLDPHVLFFAPLTKGNLTDKVSKTLPTTKGTVTTYDDYTQCTLTGTFKDAALLYKNDTVTANLSKITNGTFSVSLQCRELSYAGNHYSPWVSVPGLGECYNGTTFITGNAHAYIAGCRFASSYISTMANYVMSIDSPNKKLYLYRNGTLYNTLTNWGNSGTTIDPVSVAICLIHSNNTALSIQIKNVKVYDHKLTDTEIANLKYD